MTEWQVEARSTSTPERYRHLGLVRNPFSASGLAPDNPPGLPISSVREDLERFVSSFLQTGSYQAAVLVGPYGSGKTHHMRLLEKLFRGDPGTRVVYLASAQNDPRQVIEAVLEELGRGDLAKLVWRPVLESIRATQSRPGASIFAEFGDERVRRSRPRNAVAIFPDAGFSDDEIADYRSLILAFQGRKDLSLKKLRSYAISTLSKHLSVSAGSARLLFDTTEDEALRAAGAADQLFGATPKEPPAEEAEVLKGLSQLLTEDGTSRLVLLIDEFEGVSMLERMTRRQSVDYLYSLRMLVDKTAPASSYALVVATTPQAYDLAKDLYSPTESRFQWQIKLPVLDEKTACEILTTALTPARLAGSSDGIRPFTDEFVRALLDTGITSPRKLVVKAHRAIERAAEDAAVTEIGPDAVSQLGD